MLLITAFFLASVSWFHAQSSAGPSGHWEGTIRMHGRELTFDLDWVKNDQGEIGGTVPFAAFLTFRPAASAN
jgi:hypothetical protein